MTRRLHTAASILAFAAVYFCAGRFGQSLALVNPSASSIWPPAGLALAATLLWGYRLWPGIFLGAFLVNFATPENAATDFGIAAGNALEALLGAWLVNRFAHGANAFDRARDIFRFVLLAAMVSTVLSASVGVTSVCLGREARWEQYAAIWSTWWVGDMMGDLMVAPLLLIWLRRPWPRLRPAQVLEAAGVLFAVVLVSLFIFLPRIPSDQENQLKYLSILPLLWAAFRFRQHGASVCASVLSGVALWGTLQGGGPFVTHDPNKSLLLLQAFVGTMTLVALVLAAVVSEGQRFAQRLRVKDAVSRVLAESTKLPQAVPKIAQTLCEVAGWDVVAVWRVDRAANELVCAEFWHDPSLGVPEFAAITRQRTFAPGIGLPGRVWSSGQPAWIPDVTKDNNFPRALFAKKERLRGGVCFPIKFGDEVLGVLECFSRRVLEPDHEFLQMLANVGSQLGQFMDRAVAQEALRQNYERIHLMLGTALDAIITIDGQGSVTDWNPQAEKIFGWTKTEVLGKKLTETIIPPQYRQAHERGMRHYFKTGVGPMLAKRIEITALHRDGLEFLIELAITPIVVEEQVYFTAFIRDITQRNRVVAELHRLAQFPEQNPSPVLRISDDGALLYANPSAWLFLGKLGWKSDSVLPDVVRSVAIEARRQACLVEREICCPDGQIIWITVVPFGVDHYVNLYGRDITKRKQAEVALREAHKQILSLIEQAPLSVAMFDREMRYIVTSRQWIAEYGRGNRDLTGRSHYEVHPDLPERWKEVYEKGLAGETLKNDDDLWVQADGNKIWLRWAVSPWRDARGEIGGIIMSSEDITERKRAEAELKITQERLERTEKFSRVMLTHVGLDGRWLKVPPTLCELLGYSEEELLRGYFKDVTHPDDFMADWSQCQRIVRGEIKSFDLEKRYIRKDGGVLWVYLNCSVVADANGKPVHLLRYLLDITERKRAEERFRVAVEAAPNAMVMVDETGKIALVNSETERLFGFTREELLGQPVELLVPERFRGAHPGHRAQFFAAPSARPMGAGRDLYGLAKDGREIPIEIGLNPIRMTEGQFVLASIIDITERKRAEQILRDSNAELERRVASRTAELEVEVTERRRAEEVIRTALEEKNTLLEEIHHRVKNNLQVVSSLLQLQSAYAKNEEDVAMFKECQNRVRTMAMVHERLYRSQNLASIDFGEHVRDLASMLASSYPQAAAHVQLFTEAESVLLELETAIPAGLIINELVSNALKHAFPDGRRGTLKVRLHSPAPGQLLLSVQDDGVGLPRGFDWDQARSLGLRMVRDLTRQIRGTLEVRQNGGTTFALSFPVAKPRHKPLLQP